MSTEGETTMKFTIHPELPAVDIRRARTWYKEKLGLEPVDADDDDDEVLYISDAAKFGVYQSPHAGKNLATAARLVTADFDDVFAQLRTNGVVFEVYPVEGNFDIDHGPQPYWDDGALVFPDGEKTAWFKDSEGNILALGSSD